ncbi:hypothetical protein PQX77_021639 [Marasmius sp. AFHP31]|nr:hypothetical protein PQX77_021639 [Marasmius sp. AFHP31]
MTIPPRTNTIYRRLAPFQRIPPELLLLIFEDLLSYTKSSLSLLWLTLVCRSFYNSLTAESSLWCNLLIDIPTLEAHVGDAGLAKLARKVTRVLEYSQDKQLSLTFNLLCPGSDMDNSLASLLECISNILWKVGPHCRNGRGGYDALSELVFRCRELTFEFSLWSDMGNLTSLFERYIKHNQDFTFPTLESFRMVYNPANTIEAFAPPHALPLWRTGGMSPLIMVDDSESATPLKSPFPSLKNLTIDNITHEWSLLALSGLHTFCLRNIPSDNSPSYTEIRRLLLSNAETLTMLELTNTSISDFETVGGRFTLPNVKALTIGFAHPRDLVWASQTLDLPVLEELIVEDYAGGSDSEQMITGYQESMRCFPLNRIRRLVLRCVALPQTVEDVVPLHELDRTFFLTRFKNVKELEVSCPKFLISELSSLFSRLGEYYVER